MSTFIGIALLLAVAICFRMSINAAELDNMNPVAQKNKLGSLIQASIVNTPGDFYYVDSTNGADDPDYDGKSWGKAKATIDAAVNLCTASHGDIIFVSPYHAENLAADSAIDIDVAGVSVIGIRLGRQMPTLTATAAAGDCKLAANNVTIKNLLFIGGFDATTGVIEVTGNDCSILDCEYRDSTGQATDVIVTDNALRLLIDGYRHIGALADGGDSAIMLDECDHAVIRNFHIIGNFDVGAIECRTTASDDILVTDGYVKTAGGEDLIVKDTITGSTGFIDKITAQLKDNAANITEAFTGATFVYGNELYLVNLAGERAMQCNITASTDA